MGRRKRQKVQKRFVKKLPTFFNCPNCGQNTIKIQIDKDKKVAFLKCGNCGIEYTDTRVTDLTEPVDVYGHFIDAYYEGDIEIP